jgi:lambda family phage minor tail protein L
VSTDPAMARALQSLSPGSRVELYTLDLSPLGVSGQGSILRFSPHSRAGANLTMGGHTYTAMPMETEGFERAGRGRLARPTLTITNINNIAGTLAAEYNDLEGAVLTRTRTFEQFLDDGASPDAAAVLPADVYQINRVQTKNKTIIRWELKALMDLDGEVLPKRRVWRSFCPFVYRRYDPVAQEFDYSQNEECPYQGAAMFDANDQPVADPAQDRCGKKLASCKSRFGDNAVLPYGGFPGVSRQ